MEQLLDMLVNYIGAWGYPAIFLGMALESACLPVPSEVIFGFAGYLIFLGRLEFFMAVAAGVAGGLAGSIAAYTAGYYGGRPLVERYGKYLFISAGHVAAAQRWFDRYGMKATFFSRLLPVVRTFISLPAGFARVSFGRFVLYTVLGSLPWTILLIYAGMLLGENWSVIYAVGHRLNLGLALVVAVAVLLFYAKKRKRRSDRDR